jgi:long-chain acyl-CoA synthetase
MAGLTRESNVLLLLDDSLGKHSRCPSVFVRTHLPSCRGRFPEFLITELALASHSIPSFTLSSPSLLSPVLESHPPSAIIVDGSILPHTLELIYELNEHEHHYVVVVGETDEKALSKASAHRYHAMVRRRSTRQGGRTDNQPSSR